MKILSLVEATNVNAVAKLVIDFYVTAREIYASRSDLPPVAGSIVTFDRISNGEHQSNDFIKAVQKAEIEIDVISEAGRFDLRVVSALKEVAARREPDIIVTNSVKSHFIMWRSRLWKKCPWVAFHHGYTTTDRKMRLYNRFDRWSLPKADVVVTVCQAFARELADITGVPTEKLRVQHNSIRPVPPPSTDEVNTLRERLRVSRDQQIILCIGRLSKEKAQADLIEAFKDLSQTHHDLDSKLLIVGDGPGRESLTALAEASGFAERIVFTGQVSDVRPHYAIADVFVLPSHSEGSPNVLLEAMAARVPVVATEVGGVPEIVDDQKSALLVPAKQPPALAAAIARVLRNPDVGVKLTDAAAVRLATNHTPEQYFESIVSIYQSATESRKPLN